MFSNFFNWLLKCIKLLNSEPSDHHFLLYNSELVVIFLKFLYDQDPVKQLLEVSEADESIEVGLETVQRVREIVQFGGFSDCEHLQRTLAKEFQQMESSFKEAFQMPFTTISRKIAVKIHCHFAHFHLCQHLCLPVFLCQYHIMRMPPIPSLIRLVNICFLTTYLSIYQMSPSLVWKNVVIVRGIMHDSSIVKRGYTSVEAVLLCIPVGYYCVDLSLYKESQIVLLLNETTTTSESSGDACMMIVQANDLPYVSITRSPSLN